MEDGGWRMEKEWVNMQKEEKVILEVSSTCPSAGLRDATHEHAGRTPCATHG